MYGILDRKKEYHLFSEASESFDAQKFAAGNPLGVEARHGGVVDVVRFICQDTDDPFHGRNGGVLGRFGFAENEYPTRIDGKHRIWHGNHHTVLEITFTTDPKNTRTYWGIKIP